VAVETPGGAHRKALKDVYSSPDRLKIKLATNWARQVACKKMTNTKTKPEYKVQATYEI
jgi:hypothetical protein